jgi:hypothetical protein
MQTGGKWNAVFQLVFQLKIGIVIDFINQQVTEPIQITPAQRDHDLRGQFRTDGGDRAVFFNDKGQPQDIFQHNSNGSPKTRMIAPQEPV